MIESHASIMGSPSIIDRVIAAMREVTVAPKDGVNQKQGYSFRGSDAVVSAMAPALRRHGIVLVPLVEAIELERVPVGSQDTMMHRAVVTVRYRFHGPAGDHLDAVVVAEANDSGDKATSKAMTIALRTALLQTFALPTQDADAPTDGMHRRMMQLFTKGGIKTTQERAHYASEVLGRELETVRDCTASEVSAIISSLETGLSEPIHEVEEAPE